MTELRAEEIIVDIYKKKLDLAESGGIPEKVIMPMHMYRKIRKYHLSLGKLEGALPDYFTEDTLFGMDIHIDNMDSPIVS